MRRPPYEVYMIVNARTAAASIRNQLKNWLVTWRSTSTTTRPSTSARQVSCNTQPAQPLSRQAIGHPHPTSYGQLTGKEGRWRTNQQGKKIKTK